VGQHDERPIVPCVVPTLEVIDADTGKTGFALAGSEGMGRNARNDHETLLARRVGEIARGGAAYGPFQSVSRAMSSGRARLSNCLQRRECRLRSLAVARAM
jgi:hypothetical protein